MPSLVGPALVAAAMLAFAGAQKLVDPDMAVGAMRSLRLPSSRLLVRVGSAVELLIGVGAITLGGPLLWGAVAVSYVAFAAFVAAALRSGTMIGSCGCFGREETPPHWSHLVLNVALALAAAGSAAALDGGIVDAILDHPGEGAVVVALAGVALVLLHAAFVEMPRTLRAANALRSGSDPIVSR